MAFGFDTVRRHGVAADARLFQQNCDGNVDAVIEPFLQAGLNCLYPLENYRYYVRTVRQILGLEPNPAGPESTASGSTPPARLRFRTADTPSSAGARC